MVGDVQEGRLIQSLSCEDGAMTKGGPSLEPPNRHLDKVLSDLLWLEMLWAGRWTTHCPMKVDPWEGGGSPSLEPPLGPGDPLRLGLSCGSHGSSSVPSKGPPWPPDGPGWGSLLTPLPPLADQKPDVMYADIGGMDIQKQEVREAVELPLTHFELYKQVGQGDTSGRGEPLGGP